MKKGKDYSGERVGIITVIDYSHSKTYHYEGNRSTYRRWFNCKCDCGTLLKVADNRLSKRSVYSCGCVRNSKGKKQAQIKQSIKNPWRGTAMQNVRAEYIGRAKKKGYEFNLSSEYFWITSNQNCHYCNQEPNQLVRASLYKYKCSLDWIRNGIDRIDSSKGYTENNTVACCKTCNTMKSDLTQKQFINHIQKILKWHL